MATFQLFFQSGQAKDLSAPLYVAQVVSCKLTVTNVQIERDKVLSTGKKNSGISLKRRQ